MALEPLFSLDPLNPYQSTYDASHPSAPYGVGRLNTMGGLALAGGGDWPLAAQHGNNEIIVGYDAVAASEPLYSGADSPWQRCGAQVHFWGHNVATTNQYLLIFALRGANGSPTAQFFVGNAEVDSEAITLGQVDQHALLLDVPGDGHDVVVWIRLVSDYRYSAMAIQGMTCYLL